MYIKPSEVKRWGVDIGNVLVHNFKINTDFDNLTWEEISKNGGEIIPGALEGLKKLIDKVGADNVWIVSKVSPAQQKVSEFILEHINIYEKTGLLRDHIRFCLEKKDKAPIIKELKLDGHIDDRGEVIESLQAFLPCPIWFNPDQEDMLEWDDHISMKVLMVHNWDAIMTLLD